MAGVSKEKQVDPLWRDRRNVLSTVQEVRSYCIVEDAEAVVCRKNSEKVLAAIELKRLGCLSARRSCRYCVSSCVGICVGICVCSRIVVSAVCQ
ncbi:uncharacterized protein YALI1_C13611g [Yarrowia lipolytica]|uniref:Uncharacterized protein n=1 Tax=Yarrowia lipolytica TaxID=4952 RepID=A0A1D8NAE0_YARLL|nr:hypothetical protein YALI1_C13611g [Yarrowia lipolytica]